MIEKDPPFFWDVTCDNCSSGEERIDTDEAPSFIDVVDAIKERGWTIRKIADEFLHFCPNCK